MMSKSGLEARPTYSACVILLSETKRLRIDEEYRFIEWHWLAKQKPT